MIDAHLHFWDPARLDYPWLEHVPSIADRHGPEDWRRVAPDMEAAVFVQADCAPHQALEESDWVASLNAVQAIVAYAPLERGRAVGPHLDALRARPLVRGVRRSVQNEANDFIASPVHIDGLVAAAKAGLSIDVCARASQLADVLQSLRALFERAPHARIVLDHLGKPDIRTNGADIDADEWRANLSAIAALPNVCAKISGLTTQDDWSSVRAERLAPYNAHAVACFGPSRLMFGGDWPVVDLSGGVAAWRAAFDAAIADLTSEERAHIRHGTARRFYRIAAQESPR